MEKALQAVLGFGIRDGSRSGARDGDDREQQQHQDQRAPHGRAGRAAGKAVKAGGGGAEVRGPALCPGTASHSALLSPPPSGCQAYRPLRPSPRAQASITPHLPAGLPVFPLPSCPPTARSLASGSPGAIRSRQFLPELLLEPSAARATTHYRPRSGHHHAPLIVTPNPSYKHHAPSTAMPHWIMPPLLRTNQPSYYGHAPRYNHAHIR